MATICRYHALSVSWLVAFFGATRWYLSTDSYRFECLENPRNCAQSMCFGYRILVEHSLKEEFDTFSASLCTLYTLLLANTYLVSFFFCTRDLSNLEKNGSTHRLCPHLACITAGNFHSGTLVNRPVGHYDVLNPNLVCLSILQRSSVKSFES